MLEQFYAAVKTFNNLAGNIDVTSKGFLNQQKLIEEEAEEIAEGIRTADIVAVLDGVVDTLYVTLGMLQKLEALGCDVQGAIKQVCEDNLTKYPHKLEDAQETVRFYNAKNTNVHYTFNEQYSKYVIKDENSKVKKPFNFVPTDLSKYVPKELQEKGLL